MEKRIELEKRGRPANQITELNLDNCRSTSIVGLTDEFTALETLSLINVGLTTLKGFPKLPSLKKLELSDNRISNGLNHLTTSENLTQLNLSGNRVKDLEELQPLKTLKNLIVLDLFNNEATNSENYRKNTFELIPSLKYLDGFDCNEAEALTDSDDDEDEDEVNGNESEEDSDSEGGEASEIEVESDCDQDDDDLGEIYNDDLVDDNSDYVEENVEDEEDVDDDESEDEDENDTSVVQSPPQPADAEAPTRGKKRKHDG